MSDETPDEPEEEIEKSSRPKLSIVPKATGDGSELPLRPKKWTPPRPGYDTGYKAGQNVVCRVVKAEEGGYEVVIKKGNLIGFIKTIEKLEPSSEFLAKFVCVHKGRILLSPIFQENQSVKERFALKIVETPSEED